MAKKKRKKNNPAKREQPVLQTGKSSASRTPSPAAAPKPTAAAPKHPPAQSNTVTLSQCMIVKNEERNIEKALSWGKNIVCEQIVVDTGSTDRTVEIAEKMGAKIYHFEWIKDFAAAKNYAIEQATGDWIAFLDADEYVTEDEVDKIMPFLEQIRSDIKTHRNYLAVSCRWVQLNDKGIVKEVFEQERIFRNMPSIRYKGRIHEKLSLVTKNVVFTNDFSIMHTGYTGEAFITTGKASRNLELLRLQLAEQPNDVTIKGYLADSLKAEAIVERTGSNSAEAVSLYKTKMAEVDLLYREVLNSGSDTHSLIKESAYEHFLVKYRAEAHVDSELESICLSAYKEYPKKQKFACYYAMALNKKKDYPAAYDVLKKCEAKLNDDESSALTFNVMELFAPQMVIAAQGVGDTERILMYAEIMLLMDKKNMSVLSPYIAVLVKYYKTGGEIFTQLASIYNMKDQADLLFIARAAKDCGAISLARATMDIAASLNDT